MDLILFEHRQPAMSLFYTSFLFLPSSLVALYMEDRSLTFVYSLLCITSINFWRNPQYGIRRNVDMLLCKIGVVFLVLHACFYQTEFSRCMSLSLLLCITIFYVISLVLAYCAHAMWIVFHAAIHIYCAFCVLFITIQ